MKDREGSSRFTPNPGFVPWFFCSWQFSHGNPPSPSFLTSWCDGGVLMDVRISENPSEFPSGDWSSGLQSSPGRDRWCALTRICIWDSVSGTHCWVSLFNDLKPQLSYLFNQRIMLYVASGLVWVQNEPHMTRLRAKPGMPPCPARTTSLRLILSS